MLFDWPILAYFIDSIFRFFANSAEMRVQTCMESDSCDIMIVAFHDSYSNSGVSCFNLRLFDVKNIINLCLKSFTFICVETAVQ